MPAIPSKISPQTAVRFAPVKRKLSPPEGLVAKKPRSATMVSPLTFPITQAHVPGRENPGSKRLISKSGYVTFETDPVQGLLSHFAPYYPVLDAYIQKSNNDAQAIFLHGHDVGNYAQTMFPNGIEIPFTPGQNNPEDSKKEAGQTIAAIRAGVKAVYEATFLDGDAAYPAVCHNDILVEKKAFERMLKSNGRDISGLQSREPAGPQTEWVFVEVKSATSLHMFEPTITKTDLAKALSMDKGAAGVLIETLVRHHWVSDSQPHKAVIEWERTPDAIAAISRATGLMGSDLEKLIQYLKTKQALRPEKRQDVGMQSYLAARALEREGVGKLTDVYFAFPNSGVVNPANQRMDPWDYFAIYKVTPEAFSEHARVRVQLPHYKAMIQDPATVTLIESYIRALDPLTLPSQKPAYTLGPQMRAPFDRETPFSDVFYKVNNVPFNVKDAPVFDSVINVKGLPFDIKYKLLNAGYMTCRDIVRKWPEAILKSSSAFQGQIRAMANLAARTRIDDAVQIDAKKLQHFLSRINSQNVVALDFETVARPVPRYQGTNVWYKEPMQASLIRVRGLTPSKAEAILKPDRGEPFQNEGDRLLEYGSFPGTTAEFYSGVFNQSSPVEMARRIVSFVYDPAIPNHGDTTIIAWNAAFEQGVLADLKNRLTAAIETGSLSASQKADYQQLSNGLGDIMAHLVDIAAPFRKEGSDTPSVYHPAMAGSWSIKQAQPVYLPLSRQNYEHMSVTNGAAAEADLLKVERGDISGKEAETTLLNLIQYCNLDSEIALKLYLILYLADLNKTARIYNDKEAAALNRWHLDNVRQVYPRL